MGWSCSHDASKVLDIWREACRANSGTFKQGGKQYFYDISRTEHDDGAITGAIYHMLPGNMCRKTSTFRIEGDGTITRAPAFLKKAAVEATDARAIRLAAIKAGMLACSSCQILFPPYWLKSGVCNGCRNPESIVVLVIEGVSK